MKKNENSFRKPTYTPATHTCLLLNRILRTHSTHIGRVSTSESGIPIGRRHYPRTIPTTRRALQCYPINPYWTSFHNRQWHSHRAAFYHRTIPPKRRALQCYPINLYWTGFHNRERHCRWETFLTFVQFRPNVVHTNKQYNYGMHVCIPLSLHRER